MTAHAQVSGSYRNSPASATEWARDRVSRNRRREPVGFFSVCSAHPWVLEAAIQQAIEDDSYLCIETTSNQVNQFGGYTGVTPAEFAARLLSLAQSLGLPEHRLLLGGDHLGPYPWRHFPNETSMKNAGQLVRDCILAGYKKIHLDASMRCADDPANISEEVVARRAALLCQAAERACGESGRSADSIMYVIGTEVPVPGGEQVDRSELQVTDTSAVQTTLEVTRKSFIELGLESAWERVIGLVVQPGVEFGDETVRDYDRGQARALSQHLPSQPAIVYEAHSTDYQTAAALQYLVEDHFAILKVGPWLTFAMREAIFALSEIERNWLAGRVEVQLSNVRGALENAMVGNPEHWQSYYSGQPAELKFARRFSFSDRCRYYWSDPFVQCELKQLFQNLSAEKIPLSVLSQFMPLQYDRVRKGELTAAPASLIQDSIRNVLRTYAASTGGLALTGLGV
jgi:D-tagatose-1,6-bisphosphate aldolase subunit GatZ/KbaZ